LLSLRNLFYVLCEDVKELDYLTALQTLIDLFQSLVEAKTPLDVNVLKNQMNKWLSTITSYMKQCLDIFV
ncbi:IS4 family transposase, partial [Bacillus smithii]